MKRILKLLAASILAVLMVTVMTGSALAKVQTQACWGNTCIGSEAEM